MKEYKFVVMGSGKVGMSSLVVRYVTGHFVENYEPTIEDSYRKEVNINGTPAVLEILDTAGTGQFTAMRELYTKNGDGFILVYSVIDRQSFTDVQLLRDEIARLKDGFSSPIMLVGNICDVEGERVVATREGEMLAQEWGCHEVRASIGYTYPCSVISTLFVSTDPARHRSRA